MFRFSESHKFPPGPKRRYPGDFLFSLHRDMIGFFTKLRQYGKISYFRIGPQHIFFLNDPELIREVLVVQDPKFVKARGLERAKLLLGEGLLTSEGNFHRRQRKLIQPAFHRHRIDSYADVMTAYSEELIEQWKDKETLDVCKEMMRLTLRIAGKTFFNSETQKEAEEIGEALDTSVESFRWAVLPFSELFQLLPLPKVRRFYKAKASLDKIVGDIIAARRAAPSDHGDILSLLLTAQDVEGDGKGMSDLQIRDEVITLLLAGHETTANALTWTWYCLSQNPEVERHLHQELEQVLQGKRPTVNDIPKLPYTYQVFAESMRIFPPAFVIARKATEDLIVGDYNIPKNSVIFMSQIVTQMDPQFYPAPDDFDPTRWTPENKAKRHRFSYFPFGAGTRQCIGEQFAWMEGVLVLATIAQRWKLHLDPNHKVGFDPGITLRPKGGMSMKLEKRTKSE